MSLVFIDGFDHYGTSQVLQKWTAVTSGAATITTAASRHASGNGLRLNSSSFGTITKGFTPNATVVCGFAHKPIALGLGSGFNAQLLSFNDGSTVQVGLQLNSDGSISVTRNTNGGTVLGSSAAGVVNQNAWCYIEMKATIDPAAGSVQVRVNGTTVINVSGVNTRQSANSQAASILLGWQINSTNYDFDDVYVGTGTSSFLGDCQVDTQLPSSDGTYLQFTPSTGVTHYSLVDENPPDTTSYVSSSTVGQKDTYHFGSLTGSGSVYAVAVNTESMLSAAGSHTIANYVKSGSSEQAGSGGALSTSQLDIQDIFETDPQGGAAWTISRINAAEFGVELTA